jgi:hypothetical protein
MKASRLENMSLRVENAAQKHLACRVHKGAFRYLELYRPLRLSLKRRAALTDC